MNSWAKNRLHLVYIAKVRVFAILLTQFGCWAEKPTHWNGEFSQQEPTKKTVRACEAVAKLLGWNTVSFVRNIQSRIDCRLVQWLWTRFCRFYLIVVRRLFQFAIESTFYQSDVKQLLVLHTKTRWFQDPKHLVEIPEKNQLKRKKKSQMYWARTKFEQFICFFFVEI